MLNLNGAGCGSCQDLNVPSGASSFTFAGTFPSGATYFITAKTQPSGPSQSCNVSGGTGTVAQANISGVSVTCATNTYSVGGSVTGLTGTGLTLRLNTGTPLAISPGAGGFAFPSVPSGTNYTVTVGTQPSNPAQNCTVSNGTGTVAAANVANISVACVTVGFTIGGAITGLTGSGLVLQNNGGNDLAVASGATSFVFAGQVNAGATYSVTVKTQPASPSQTCTAANATGTANANITNVVINCVTNTQTIGGTITGLSAAGLSLLLNGASPLTVPSGATAFTFPATLAPGSTYTVTVGSHPTGQTCAVTSGTGTVGAGNVTGIAVTCANNAANTWTVGGTITGLSSVGLVLLLNGGAALTVAPGAVAFAFPAVASGTAYTVTIGTQPASQTCTVSNATGTVGAGNVTSVSINCAAPRYTVGGTINGLVGSGLSLLLNGGARVTLPAGATTFTFLGTYPTGTAYTATVSIQPSNPAQICAIANPTGTVGTSNVTDITINCGFTVSGTHATTVLRANGGVLLLNGGSPVGLIVDKPGFTFPLSIPAGSPYSVTVGTQPSAPAHTCAVQNANGTMGAAPVTNVTVTCLPNGNMIGGQIAGYTGNGLTLRINEGTPIVPQSKGKFAFPDFYPTGAEFRATIASQPTGPVQTCTMIRATGAMPPPGGQGGVFGVLNLGVACISNTTSPLSGTWSFVINGKTSFLTFWPDGRYAFALRSDDASCGASNGNGVEYGVYTWNAATGAFAILSGALDTNGGCGLWDGGANPAVGLTGTLTRTGDVLSLTFAEGTIQLNAVASTPSTFVGSWQEAGDSDGGFVVLRPDNTFLFVQTQAGAGGTGIQVGYERGCYTITGSSIAFSLSGSCLPDGAPPIDLNGTAGVSGVVGASLSFVITGPNTVTVDGDSFLVRLMP